jgi:preprotein translocase subunit SecD
MKSTILKRTLFILAVVLASLYGIFGIPSSASTLEQNIQNRISLGLDLRGGTYLVLQVNVQDAINSEADQTIERLKADLQQRQVTFASMTRIDAKQLTDDGGIHVEGVPPEQNSTFRQAVEETEPNWTVNPDGNNYNLTLKASVLNDIRQRTLSQSVETIRNRIDSLGVSEPTIQERGQGDYEILVELPGVDDPQRVKELIQTTALLEIRQVQDGPYPSKEAALSAHSGVLPPDTELLESSDVSQASAGGEAVHEWYLVNRVPAVAGRQLRSAQPGRDENNRPEVDFTLTADGARRFADFTEKNIGQKLAVVLDGRIKSVATIESRIADSGRIQGRFTQQEASDLALVLRAGALPASMSYLEERTVGPSLGADSIRSGVFAAIAGSVAVMLFMLVYYHLSGVNAVLALILNLVLLLAALGYFHATLTLPGIAGVILTIGMAVDTNVLVFERIREELRAGKTAVSSVQASFSKVWVIIIDTHVTTIIAAFFLFLFGTGPVKGFAITLSLGLGANLFTGMFVSRVMFDYVLSRSPRQARLSI